MQLETRRFALQEFQRVSSLLSLSLAFFIAAYAIAEIKWGHVSMLYVIALVLIELCMLGVVVGSWWRRPLAFVPAIYLLVSGCISAAAAQKAARDRRPACLQTNVFLQRCVCLGGIFYELYIFHKQLTEISTFNALHSSNKIDLPAKIITLFFHALTTLAHAAYFALACVALNIFAHDSAYIQESSGTSPRTQLVEQLLKLRSVV